MANPFAPAAAVTSPFASPAASPSGPFAAQPSFGQQSPVQQPRGGRGRGREAGKGKGRQAGRGQRQERNGYGQQQHGFQQQNDQTADEAQPKQKQARHQSRGEQQAHEQRHAQQEWPNHPRQRTDSWHSDSKAKKGKNGQWQNLTWTNDSAEWKKGEGWPKKAASWPQENWKSDDKQWENKRQERRPKKGWSKEQWKGGDWPNDWEYEGSQQSWQQEALAQHSKPIEAQWQQDPPKQLPQKAQQLNEQQKALRKRRNKLLVQGARKAAKTSNRAEVVEVLDEGSDEDGGPRVPPGNWTAPPPGRLQKAPAPPKTSACAVSASSTSTGFVPHIFVPPAQPPQGPSAVSAPVQTRVTAPKPALPPVSSRATAPGPDKGVSTGAAQIISFLQAPSGIQPPLDHSEGIVGTLEVMCSESEILDRTASRQLDVFEMAVGSRPERAVANPELAVKKYHRSSADKQYQPEDTRSLQACTRSLRYLLSVVEADVRPAAGTCEMAQSADYWKVYSFLRDRTRAIRVDLNLQEWCKTGQVFIQVHEICLRFEIMSMYLLQATEECLKKYDAKMALKSCSSVMEPLIGAYAQARAQKRSGKPVYISPAEPEMQRLFVLLLFIGGGDMNQAGKHMMTLPLELLSHPYVRWAANVVSAFDRGEEKCFLNYFSGADFLSATILWPMVNVARNRLLRKWVRSTVPTPLHDKMVLSDATRFLSFLDDAEASDFIQFNGIQVVEYGTGKSLVHFPGYHQERRIWSHKIESADGYGGEPLEERFEKRLGGAEPAAKDFPRRLVEQQVQRKYDGLACSRVGILLGDVLPATEAQHGEVPRQQPNMAQIAPQQPRQDDAAKAAEAKKLEAQRKAAEEQRRAQERQAEANRQLLEKIKQEKLAAELRPKLEEPHPIVADTEVHEVSSGEEEEDEEEQKESEYSSEEEEDEEAEPERHVGEVPRQEAWEEVKRQLAEEVESENEEDAQDTSEGETDDELRRIGDEESEAEGPQNKEAPARLLANQAEDVVPPTKFSFSTEAEANQNEIAPSFAGLVKDEAGKQTDLDKMEDEEGTDMDEDAASEVNSEMSFLDFGGLDISIDSVVEEKWRRRNEASPYYFFEETGPCAPQLLQRLAAKQPRSLLSHRPMRI